MSKKGSETITKHCKECGTGAIKNSTICTKCGAKLRTSAGMQRVSPINSNQVESIRASIHVGAFADRNEFMLLLLLNTALRISDALSITVKMVRNKDYLDIVEMKTDKAKHFPMNKDLKEAINTYTKDMEEEDFLFQSRDRDKNGNRKPISRVQAFKILKECSAKIGIPNFSPHGARKAYARGLYEKTGDLSLIMRLLNHSSQEMTLHYLHLQDEEDEARIMDFSLF